MATSLDRECTRVIYLKRKLLHAYRVELFLLIASEAASLLEWGIGKDEGLMPNTLGLLQSAVGKLWKCIGIILLLQTL